MDKIIILGAFLIIAMGCISNTTPQNVSVENNTTFTPANSMPSVPVPNSSNPISVSENGNVDTINIMEQNISGGLAFPETNYSGEFLSVGLYSDYFIMLNSSQIRFLNDNENIWLTPLKSSNRMMLFNAIYSNNVSECNPSNVTILGKTYSMNQLKNNSDFQSDGKWKVALDYQGSCLKRVIVYMDGYYGNLSDGQQVDLFRDDNTVIFSFMNLETAPSMEIVATKPS